MTPEQLAAQLRHPNGEEGNNVADNMDDRNSPVILAAYDALAPRRRRSHSGNRPRQRWPYA